MADGIGSAIKVDAHRVHYQSGIDIEGRRVIHCANDYRGAAVCRSADDFGIIVLKVIGKYPINLHTGRWAIAAIGIGDLAHGLVDQILGGIRIEGQLQCAPGIEFDAADGDAVYLKIAEAQW